MESGKYGWEWQDDLSKGPSNRILIPKGDRLTRVQCQPPM
jgi:hypothetical protein